MSLYENYIQDYNEGLITKNTLFANLIIAASVDTKYAIKKLLNTLNLQEEFNDFVRPIIKGDYIFLSSGINIYFSEENLASLKDLISLKQ